MSGARGKYFRTRPCSAIISGQWKLIEYFEDNEFELYDLKNDISEKNNLKDSNPEQLKKLYAIMQQWRKSTKAPIPNNPNPKYDPKFNPLIYNKVR